MKCIFSKQQKKTEAWMLKTTSRVGKSMKMCRSSLPGLVRALSRTSARLVEARTMTWSVVPIPARHGANVSPFSGKGPPPMTANCCAMPCVTHHPSPPAAGWGSAPLQCWRTPTCWWSASSPQRRSHRCRQCRVLCCEPPWTDSLPEQHPGLHANATHVTRGVNYQKAAM